ncbi:MAG: HTTM domain-containing protein [Oligoflexales bacterium]
MKFMEAVKKFFFTPSTAFPLACLRIGMTSLLILQSLSLSRQLLDFYGVKGFVQLELNEYLIDQTLPKISWLAAEMGKVGVAYDQTLLWAFLLYLASLVTLLLGWRTRISAIVAWFLHFMFMNSNGVSNYGVDQFYHIALFYFVWMPVGSALSLDVAEGRTKSTPTSQTTIALRVIQIHLCLVYFVAGWGKMQGHMWWTGEAIWRSLLLPEYQSFDFYWLAKVPFIATLAAWGTLILETLYPVFIWFRKTRLPWVVAVIGLHLGIAVFQGLELFGATMIVFTTSMFGAQYLRSFFEANFARP